MACVQEFSSLPSSNIYACPAFDSTLRVQPGPFAAALTPHRVSSCLKHLCKPTLLIRGEDQLACSSVPPDLSACWKKVKCLLGLIERGKLASRHGYARK